MLHLNLTFTQTYVSIFVYLCVCMYTQFIVMYVCVASMRTNTNESITYICTYYNIQYISHVA